MSFQAMTWAIDQDVGSPSARCVLMSIANYANTEWCAWPKQETIARESVQSVDSVQRRMPELVGAKLIRRIKLKRFGRRTHDFYILPPSPYFSAELEEIRPLLPSSCDVVEDTEVAAAECGSDKNDSPPIPPQEPQSDAAANCGDPESATLPQSADDATATVRSQEPSKEPKDSPPTPKGEWGHEKSWKKFEETWGEPILHQKLCREIWGKLAESDRDAVILAASGYVAHRRGQRRPSPVCNAQKFLREPEAWPGYAARAPNASGAVIAGTAIPIGTPAGRAHAALCRIAHVTPLEIGGTYRRRSPLSTRGLALADVPPETDWIFIAAEQRPQRAAWDDFIKRELPGLNRPELAWDRNPGRQSGFLAPWPWPPKADGSTYSGSDPPPLVPGTLATEEDFEEIAKG